MRSPSQPMLSASLVVAALLVLRACDAPSEPTGVASVAVAPGAVSIYPTQTAQLTATALSAGGNPSSGAGATWSSSNLTAATVNGSGMVTAVAVGTATITAAVNGIGGRSTVTVVAVPVVSVEVAPSTGNITIGRTVQLGATPRDSVSGTLAGRAVTWGSSDLGRATVSVSGLVTAVGLGTVTITATSEGIDGTAQFTVVPVPVDSVSVSPAATTRYPTQTVQLSATVMDSAGATLTGRTVTWASSSVAVATVNGSGLVTAVAVGSATITATSEGVIGRAAITVSPVPVASVVVTPDSAARAVGDTVRFVAATRDSAGGSLVGRTVVWSTLDPTIASVSATGLATALAQGLARIVAASEGRADTARLSVTAPVAPGPAVVGPFDVHVTASRDNAQGVATDGVNALYAIQTGSLGGGDNSLFVKLLDSTGVVVSGPTALGANGDPPAVAYGGGAYLAASWIPATGAAKRTVAWTVSSSGLIVGAPIVIHQGTDAAAVCGLGYAGGTFAIAYMRQAGVNAVGDTLSRVYARTISATGVVGSELALSGGFATCGLSINGGVASDGTTFLVVWAVQDSVTASGGAGVRARTMSAAGALGTVQTVRTTIVPGRALSVAARSTGGWVVGIGELMNLVTANFDSYIQPLAADGSVSGGLITVDNTTAPVLVTVSEWASGFVALTIERTGIASTQVVRFRRYNTAATPTGTDLVIAGVNGTKIPYALSLTGSTRIFITLEFFTPGATFLTFDRSTGDVRGAWVRP